MAAGTRSKAAMEEQTVQILTALQTQGQQQMEQLRRQFEILATTQQEQNTRAAMKMREQIDQLAAVQQDQHHRLERKLTEETSLLASTQSTMEEKLASLERQLETVREHEAEEATVKLETSTTPPARKLREPGSFDGSGSWEAYKTQFQMLAHLNRLASAPRSPRRAWYKLQAHALIIVDFNRIAIIVHCRNCQDTAKCSVHISNCLIWNHVEFLALSFCSWTSEKLMRR